MYRYIYIYIVHVSSCYRCCVVAVLYMYVYRVVYIHKHVFCLGTANIINRQEQHSQASCTFMYMYIYMHVRMWWCVHTCGHISQVCGFYTTNQNKKSPHTAWHHLSLHDIHTHHSSYTSLFVVFLEEGYDTWNNHHQSRGNILYMHGINIPASAYHRELR